MRRCCASACPSGETQEVKDLGSGAPEFARGRPGHESSTCRRIPQDFRIDTFERLWFSSIFVTVFACFWLLFAAIAWALSRESMWPWSASGPSR